MTAREYDPALLEFAGRIFDLARHGLVAELCLYVDEGLPVDLTDDKGDSLLMLAAYHGHAELVTALLERGADPNRVNDLGQTPLAGAVFKGHDAVVRALRAAGAAPQG
jgi:uncharacterized protein